MLQGITLIYCLQLFRNGKRPLLLIIDHVLHTRTNLLLIFILIFIYNSI